MKPLVLRPIQEPMVDWAMDHKRCEIWAGMGSGKTSSMEFLIALLKLCGMVGNEPWLVLAPMRVARDTWPEDIARWSQFSNMRIMPLTGTPAQRKDKLRCKADIFTISYELAPWLVDHWEAKWPYRNVIADESDRLKGFREKRGGVKITSKNKSKKATRAHSIGRVCHNLTDRWINLTGTPCTNGLKDLWAPHWFIDRGAALGRTHSAFMQRWFKPKWSGFGVEPMPHSEAEIHAALRPSCITIDPKDYYDLKDPIVVPIKIKLPERARKIYDALEKELFATIGPDVDIEVFNQAALMNKCLQLANGAVYTEYPSWASVHDEKIEAIRSVLGEAGGMPVLLRYSFKSDLARIKTAFPRAVELATPQGMAAFRAGDAPIGLAHPKSLGHGIDGLQNVTNILIRFGHGWNLGEEMQFLERIGPMRQLQAGLDRPVWVYEIIAENTIEDEDVIPANIMKKGVQDSLLYAMNRRHNA